MIAIHPDPLHLRPDGDNSGVAASTPCAEDRKSKRKGEAASIYSCASRPTGIDVGENEGRKSKREGKAASIHSCASRPTGIGVGKHEDKENRRDGEHPLRVSSSGSLRCQGLGRGG